MRSKNRVYVLLSVLLISIIIYYNSPTVDSNTLNVEPIDLSNNYNETVDFIETIANNSLPSSNSTEILVQVSDGPLRVSGSNLVNVDGDPVKIYGVTMKQLSFTAEHYEHIKSLGINTVTFVTWWGGTLGPTEEKEEPYIYDEDGLDKLLTQIRYADEAGLYVIHQIRVCYNPRYTRSGNYQWAGWATNDDIVYNNPDNHGNLIRYRFTAYLTWIAENVLSEPNVIGIEPWHFPYHQTHASPSDVQKYFLDVCPEMIVAIRKESDKIIFLSPPGLGSFNYNKHPGPYLDANIVYNTGGYGDLYIVNGRDKGRMWDYNVDAIGRPHMSWLEFKETNNVPMISTEGPGVAQWNWRSEDAIPQHVLDLFEATLEYCDKIGGWSIQYYGGSEDQWGILLDKNKIESGIICEIISKHT